MSAKSVNKSAMNATSFAETFSAGLVLPSEIDPRFAEALRHVLDHPGSLVRPRMVLLVASAYGLEDSAAQDLAVALEYFHTASLIFDDLPCMDNAMERRGVPCVHFKYGEAEAILSALALINRAYALIWRGVYTASPESQRCAMVYIEQLLGVHGLLNGQSLDLHFATMPHNRKTTERIARGKTVSLIRLTLVLPAILGGASARELQLLERIALYWGLAYQMTDDLKDILDSQAKAGKTVARDLLLDRPNAASVMGIPAAIERLIRFIDLGDRSLARLLQVRLGLSFLSKLRSSLEEELVRITGSLREMSLGARS
jgi:geranylgeranyl pyrophosphate synthase